MTKEKEVIRKEILERLKNQTNEDRSFKSEKIEEKLLSLEVFKKARVVMFYVSLKEEVNTHHMIEQAIENGKRVAVPHSISCSKEILAAELKDPKKDLELGPYGIRQPKKNTNFKEIPLEKIDLVIVPGAAFDKENNRLGRGKGYYDRFLKKLPSRIPTIGLCFDFQLVNRLPKDSHDIPVSRVITN